MAVRFLRGADARLAKTADMLLFNCRRGDGGDGAGVVFGVYCRGKGAQDNRTSAGTWTAIFWDPHWRRILLKVQLIF